MWRCAGPAGDSGPAASVATSSQRSRSIRLQNLPPESLAPAGNLIHDEGQKLLTTTTTDATIQTPAVENGMQITIVIDNVKASNYVSYQIHVANGLTAMAKPHGATDFMDANGVAIAGLATPVPSIPMEAPRSPSSPTFGGGKRWWQMGISDAAGAAVGAAVVTSMLGSG